MNHIGWAFNHVAFPNQLPGFSFYLVVTDPIGNNEQLPGWVRMPVRAGARRKGDAASNSRIDRVIGHQAGHPNGSRKRISGSSRCCLWTRHGLRNLSQARKRRSQEGNYYQQDMECHTHKLRSGGRMTGDVGGYLVVD